VFVQCPGEETAQPPFFRGTFPIPFVMCVKRTNQKESDGGMNQAQHHTPQQKNEKEENRVTVLGKLRIQSHETEINPGGCAAGSSEPARNARESGWIWPQMTPRTR